MANYLEDFGPDCNYNFYQLEDMVKHLGYNVPTYLTDVDDQIDKMCEIITDVLINKKSPVLPPNYDVVDDLELPESALEEMPHDFPFFASDVMAFRAQQKPQTIKDLVTFNTIRPIKRFPYTLGKILGDGTFGTVYKSVDPYTNKDVAVKRIKTGSKKKYDWALPMFDDEVIEMVEDLYNEIRALKKLSISCPKYVINYIDAIVEFKAKEDQVYIITDLHPGITLNEWLTQKRTNRSIRQVTDNLIAGLKCIHSSGIAHRDIKMSNIMIDPKTLETQYIDFGLSCITNLCEYVEGTFPYRMAPEFSDAYNNKDLPESLSVEQDMDKWALGVVIFALMTGGVVPNDIPWNVKEYLYKLPYSKSKTIAETLLQENPEDRHL
jgi:serine/threonine protein kinase